MPRQELEFITARRSIRTYTEREVDAETVKDLLRAAMAAPSACCRDPWRFVVVRERERLARLASGLPNGQMLAHAGVGIVVCGELEAAHDGQESYMLQDCSASIQNLLLAANALGLGACWLGVHPREDRMAHLRQALGLPETVVPVAAIAVGWPAEQKAPRTRYDAAKVHDETWSSGGDVALP